VVSVSAVKLTPSKPNAGAAVTATVRVTAGGDPVRPAGVSCAGTVGGAKLKGTPRTALGSATCLYRPPKTTKGKTLAGAITFIVKGQLFTKRFSAKLR
jgi:hypothetical protein